MYYIYRHVVGLAPPNLWQQGCSPTSSTVNRQAWTMMTTSIVWWRPAGPFVWNGFPIGDGILGWNFVPVASSSDAFFINFPHPYNGLPKLILKYAMIWQNLHVSPTFPVLLICRLTCIHISDYLSVVAVECRMWLGARRTFTPEEGCGGQHNNKHSLEFRGPSKSSILMGFSLVNHPFGGTPIYGTPPYMP